MDDEKNKKKKGCKKMTEQKKFDAVIFDADETIFNNEGIHLFVTIQVLRDLQLPSNLAEKVHSKWDAYYFQEQSRLMEEVGYCIDRENAARSLVLALKDFNKEITYSEAYGFFKYMIEAYSTKSKPYPDAVTLIKLLEEKRLKMAIISNGDTEVIMNRLRVANLVGHFEFILAPCMDYPLTKPDEKIFHDSLKRLETLPEKTIFIGDNPSSDIEGANRVKMYSVLIDRKDIYTTLEGLQKPKKKIKSFDELHYLFDQ